MPILAVLDTPEEPVPTGPPEGEPRVHAWWRGGNGDEIHLTECPAGIDWLDGRGGEDLPPYEVTEDTLPQGDQPYGVVRGVRAAPRTYTFPLLIHNPGNAGFRTRQQRVLRAFDPTTGDGRLRLLQPNGDERSLTARYSSGAEGSDIQDRAGLWWRVYAVQLRALDPYWSSMQPKTLTFGGGGDGGAFFPLLPVRLAASSVLGETTAQVEGDAPSWGIWTITGPANGITTLANTSLGLQVKLNLTGDYELAEDEQLVVDMRPARPRIVGPDGDSWYGARVGVPQMWPLLPGPQDIELAVAGATGATSLRFDYVPRWLAA